MTAAVNPNGVLMAKTIINLHRGTLAMTITNPCRRILATMAINLHEVTLETMAANLHRRMLAMITSLNPTIVVIAALDTSSLICDEDLLYFNLIFYASLAMYNNTNAT